MVVEGEGGDSRRHCWVMIRHDSLLVWREARQTKPITLYLRISWLEKKVLWNRYKTRENSFKYYILFSRESPLYSLECRFPDVSVSPPVGEKLPWSPLCLLTSINPVVVNYGQGLIPGETPTVFSDKLLVPDVLRLQIWQWRDRSVVVTDKRWDIPWSENANSLQSLYPD